jgi:hypothetical protein
VEGKWALGEWRAWFGNEVSKAAAKDALERLEDFRTIAWQVA